MKEKLQKKIDSFEKQIEKNEDKMETSYHKQLDNLWDFEKKKERLRRDIVEKYFDGDEKEWRDVGVDLFEDMSGKMQVSYISIHMCTDRCYGAEVGLF